jgi:hypothetical protein
MRKRKMSAGGCLFTVGTIALVLYGAIYRAMEGHLPSDLSFFLWWLIGLSIAGEIYIDLHDAIDKSTAEIKAELERLDRKIEGQFRNLDRN